MKDRLHYIDITKGLLILMVAYGHVYYTICHNYGFNNTYMTMIHNVSNAWVAFYMPAFFVITGMCSNFNKDIKSFVYSNMKTILLPAFTLGLIIHAIGWILADKDFYIGLKVFLKGVSYWFLFALFVAKTLFYVLNRYLGSLKKLGIVTIALYCIFGIVHEYLPNVPNYWCWIHAIGLIPFLTLGQVLKRQDVLGNKKAVVISGGVYLVILVLYTLLEVRIPRITGGIYLPIIQLLPHLVLSATGSILILAICKFIHQAQWLESLGKHSLVIYCLHEGMLSILAPWIGNNIVQATPQQAFVYYTMILIYVVVMSWLISVLLNKKPQSIIIGKK